MKTSTIIGIGVLALAGVAAYRLLAARTSSSTPSAVSTAAPDLPANGGAPSPPPSPTVNQSILTAANYTIAATSRGTTAPVPPLRAPALVRELRVTPPSPPVTR